MNRLSTSIFGQLFYLRNGLFVTKGLSFAQKHGHYREIFSVSSMKHSSLYFKMSPKPDTAQKNNTFFFESLINLNGKYRELYRFRASQFGVSEHYGLAELQDGWFEQELQWDDVAALVNTLKQGEHIVHDSSCFTDKP